MSARQLPERPNLEQLKRQAKDLLHSVRQRDPAALERARALPSFTSEPDDRLTRAFALHDAQSLVAREHGFDSWNALREHVESATLEFGAAVREFIAAATDGRPDRAERLLEMHPGIVSANLYTALLLGSGWTLRACRGAGRVCPNTHRTFRPAHGLLRGPGSRILSPLADRAGAVGERSSVGGLIGPAMHCQGPARSAPSTRFSYQEQECVRPEK